ncbi:MAG: molecular chaperone DnaK [Planctomycetes bacterium]|nr:molecular chaperone DnaK [Planctomycetota bacterium]
MTDKAQTDELVIGIDLGTTNSLAAVATPTGPKVLRKQDGSALIPSVVCFRPDGEVVVGQEARDLALQYPERTVQSIKRLVGRSGSDVAAELEGFSFRVITNERGLPRVSVDDKEYSPEQISARILAAVRDVASRALGHEIRAVVITVPAYFDDAQRQATKHAAELAGLDCRRIVNEPTAASLAYGIDGSKDGTALVYDLGGGTFDVSVLRIRDGVFQVLSTSGDTHLGGDDFDRLLIDEILTTIAHSADELEGLDPFARQAIRRAAESLKFQLGEADAATLTIDLGAAGSTEVTVTRQRFEQLIAPLVARTITCCRRAMRDAELEVSDLDHVVLVGGSTRVPLVRREIEQFAGRAPATSVDPDLAVGMGAALQAGVLAGKDSSLLLLDVVPLSLGLETMGGVVSKLILRNATIPASVTEEFSTQVDDQTAVDINVYQGERERVEDCRKLGSFKLRGIPPMPAGLPRIAVTFTIDADGVLRVSAREQRTGTEAEIQIVPSFGLTDEEVKRMMEDSIEHAFDDMSARELVELRNKAQAMVTGTTKALELSDLPADRTYSIKRATKQLAAALESDPDDTQKLRTLVDELSALTAQIADDVISSAVKKSLSDES